MTFILSRFGNSEPRLVQVTSEHSGRFHGRDVMRGTRALVRARDVIARHDEERAAIAALRRVREAIAEEDARVAQAWAAYAKAQRRREKAIALAAGKVP